jgi:phosphomannomutase
MGERGVLLKKTRIGSPYVIDAMQEVALTGRYARVVGWEANGGFLTASEVTPKGGAPLGALPTRDAVLPILANLYAARDKNCSLSKLWSELPARFGRAGLLDDVPVATCRAVIAGLTPPGGQVEVDLRKGELLEAKLATVFTPSLGFGAPVHVNTLDGVRITFSNGDVAHVRPSGNAPQLRIYANSDSQSRADRIVELALRSPGGILHRLMTADAPRG